MILLPYIIAACLYSALCGACVAHLFRRRPFLGFSLGFFLGPFGWLIIPWTPTGEEG